MFFFFLKVKRKKVRMKKKKNRITGFQEGRKKWLGCNWYEELPGQQRWTVKGYKGSFKCQCSRSDYAEGTCVHLHVLFQRLPCFTTVAWDRWTGWPVLGSFLTTYFRIRPIIHTSSSSRISTCENIITHLKKQR